MKKSLYYFFLTVTVLAVVVLLGIAIGIAVFRPSANYVSPDGLPSFILPDCFVSALYLAIAALVCFVGSLLIQVLNYDDQNEQGGTA